MTKEQAPETIAATYGVATDAAFGAVAPPIYLTSTFTFEAPRVSRRLQLVRRSIRYEQDNQQIFT
ncbi:hypothetical protein [Novosphingobium sp. ST904]|uniref:hypothetical protein n=1 Tax=Novosphingobium sp. ST904 TaxID=1684385 RepID=UPI001042BB56|nr:hypothetical protein [Novosphingobium sp. ST904]